MTVGDAYCIPDIWPQARGTASREINKAMAFALRSHIDRTTPAASHSVAMHKAGTGQPAQASFAGGVVLAVEMSVDLSSSAEDREQSPKQQ